MKQFAPACERNKEPILAVLREIFDQPGLIMEIGSGTGQHAAYFARHLPHLQWQPCDLPACHPSIAAYRADAGVENFLPPLSIDLVRNQWPLEQCDGAVCINTIHIVAWNGVENLFTRVGRVLAPGGVFYVYGPYRYATRPLEPSNAAFDASLQIRDPASGLREFEAINALAAANGLVLEEDRAMPANNRSIWWRKTDAGDQV